MGLSSIVRSASCGGLALGVALGLAGGTASGQVVINEVWENVPGDADLFDVRLEYIELYGRPGMDLTGYAIALVKGGADPDGDDIADLDPEIDEAFSLDGLALGANGLLVIYNDTDGVSDVPGLIDPATSGRGFVASHIPSTDTPGRLENSGSSTYLLVRARPGHSVVNGLSVYEPWYAFRKDVRHDTDFDGQTDFGFETPDSSVIDPMQVIDGVAWSNAGGKEYVRSSQQEISDTPGFNPDGVSRVAYYGTNPMRGLRINSDEEVVPTRMADEEFIYGEQGPDDGQFTYLLEKTSFEIVNGMIVQVTTDASGAPTDPDGDGFQDIDITGFEITPGRINDGVAGTPSETIVQFRFVRGDFDFDGVAGAMDGAMINASIGEHLDVLEPCVDENGDPVFVGGERAQCYVYQSRLANGLLAMMAMDLADGPGGANADEVTAADAAAWRAEFGDNCVADFTGDGSLDLFDILAFFEAFGAGSLAADIDSSGALDLFDILGYFEAFAAGC